jgi:hypothetical protein
MSPRTRRTLLFLLTPALFVFGCLGTVQDCRGSVETVSAMQLFKPSDLIPPVVQTPPAQTSSTTAQTESAVPSGFLVADAHVSDSFVQEINRDATLLPAKLLKALSLDGYKIEISHTVTEAVPSARNEQVRGYAPHSTWDAVFGMFNRTSRKVVMAEFAQPQNSMDADRLITLTIPERRSGILRHEFGHAVDDYLANFSHTPEFRQAYEKGKIGLTSAEKSLLWYYLQAGDAGPEETFAELFASLEQTACDRSSDQLLHKHFSELADLIRTKIASIQ